MGLLGLGVNAEHLESFVNLQIQLSSVILSLGWFSFIFLTIHYLAHLLSNNASELTKEWHDPFKRSFLPAFTLTGILFIFSVSQIIDRHSFFNDVLFIGLAGLVSFHLFLNLFLINGWLFHDNVRLDDHKPTWFILISGNFVSVITFMVLYRESVILHEISLFFYSVGLFLWLIFATTLMYRLMFAKPISHQFRPSLFIFLAPPSLACVASMLLSDSYIKSGLITPESIQLIAWLSYSFATIMFLVWLSQGRFFISSGLSMAGWSYIYPLAAYGLATQYMAEALHSYLLVIYSLALLFIVLIIMALLLYWLFQAARKTAHQTDCC